MAALSWDSPFDSYQVRQQTRTLFQYPWMKAFIGGMWEWRPQGLKGAAPLEGPWAAPGVAAAGFNQRSFTGLEIEDASFHFGGHEHLSIVSVIISDQDPIAFGGDL